jgi:hypothetical protein
VTPGIDAGGGTIRFQGVSVRGSLLSVYMVPKDHGACPAAGVHENHVSIGQACGLADSLKPSITAQENTKVPRNKGGDMKRVLNQWCDGKVNTLGDTEQVVRWWQDNLV